MTDRTPIGETQFPLDDIEAAAANGTGLEDALRRARDALPEEDDHDA
jgi:hypothetical protein